MSVAHVITLHEAAEQTGLTTDTILKIAADHSGVMAKTDGTMRIDPWALNAVLADEGFKQAA